MNFSKRDILMFLAGIEFFHAFAHLIMLLFVELPLKIWFIVLTRNLDLIAFIINLIVAILLLWFALKTKNRKR